MAKHCEHCGKMNNNFVADPLELSSGKILCHTCAEPIAYDMNQLYYAKTKAEYFQQANAIIGKSKTLYNENIVNDIAATIQMRSKELCFAEDQPTPSDDNASGGLYKNVGGKIKTLTSISTWIGILASIIIGIAIIRIDEALVLPGILVIGFGSFSAWLSGLLVYGYGQLIENSDKLVENSKKLVSASQTKQS